jgi:hypothetical protein
MAMRYFLLALLGGVLAGCRPPPPSPSASTDIEVNLQTPQAAARSLMELLQAHLAAVARRDRAAAEAYRDQIAREVVARDDVMARFDQLPGRSVHGAAEVLPRLVESWASAVAYYADGLDLEHMRIAASAESGRGVVDIPARGPADQATLVVACVRGPDEKWRVIGLEFAVPTTSRPATRPVATSSAPS